MPDTKSLATIAPLSARLGAVLYIQLAWAVLSALWNIGGVIQISQGLRAPGPTASLLLAGVLLAYGVALLVARRRWPVAYAALSILGIVFALPAIINALTADTKLWPSEFWRYAGIALNSSGALACLSGIVSYAQRKKNGELRFKGSCTTD